MAFSKNREIEFKKLQAFTELLAEDIADALNHDLEAEPLGVALLLYAASVFMSKTSLDAEEFIQYAAEAWNERLASIDEAPCILYVDEDEDSEKN